MFEDEDGEIVNFDAMSMGDLQEAINDLYENIPKDKRKKEYKPYIAEYNKIVAIYNKRAGTRIYTTVKN
jgi:hemerythrin superfamily protein